MAGLGAAALRDHPQVTPCDRDRTVLLIYSVAADRGDRLAWIVAFCPVLSKHSARNVSVDRTSGTACSAYGDSSGADAAYLSCPRRS